MKKTFSHMQARALCHATERLDRVERAMRNVVGDVEVESTRTTGHHGNEIVVLEARSGKVEERTSLFSRLSSADLDELIGTADGRVDEACVFHLRLDKQEAFGDRLALARSDDAIALRFKVRSYPAKEEVARRMVSDFLRAVREDTASA